MFEEQEKQIQSDRKAILRLEADKIKLTKLRKHLMNIWH